MRLKRNSRLWAQVAGAEVVKMRESLQRIEEDLNMERKAFEHLRNIFEKNYNVSNDDLACLEEVLARF